MVTKVNVLSESTQCRLSYSATTVLILVILIVGRSSQILNSKQCNPLICDIKEGHKASTQTKFH